MNLRATDPETARVVAVLGEGNTVVGAGCLIDDTHVITCCHVVEAALRSKSDGKVTEGRRVWLRLVGFGGREVRGTVEKVGNYYGRGRLTADDLVLLSIAKLRGIAPAEFAAPMQHGGKRYSVLGFPDGDPHGRNASGVLHGANAAGLVQMDGNSALFVKGGFSGAPVWSRDLRAFVGIVVQELSDFGVAWCIPSRILCSFHLDLPVRFRIPPEDRPVVNDYNWDDPNIDLFGTVSETAKRRLTAKVTEQGDDEDDEYYCVTVRYECLRSEPARGRYVTFITYPDFEQDEEDAYELFTELDENGVAEQEFYPIDLFTVAAIGDGGDTVLTLDLCELEPESEEED